MLLIVGFLLGAAIGAAVMARRTGRPAGAAPAAPSPREPSPLGPRDHPTSGDPFAHALTWVLDDIRDHLGAALAVLYDVDADGVLREHARGGGRAADAPDTGADFQVLARQAAADRRTILAPDAAAPRVAVAAVGRDDEVPGVLGVAAPEGFGIAPGDLRRWMDRYAGRVADLRELLRIRDRLAANNKVVTQTQRAIAQFQGAQDDLPELARRVAAEARAIAGAEAVWLVRWTGDAGRLVRAIGDDAVVPVPSHDVLADSLIADVCRDQQPVQWPDLQGAQARRTLLGGIGGAAAAGAVMITPLLRGREAIGALVFLHRAAGRFAAGELRNAVTITALAAFPLAIAWRLEDESRRSETDPLTGAWNRRRFDSELARALEATGRTGLPTALLLVDLDHFKRVNDTYGHDAGDAVLVRVAAVLRERVRQLDVVARLGGEEFAVLLPQTGLDGALELAERLRSAIEAAPIGVGGKTLRVTASIGAASYPGTVEQRDGLFKGADDALYAAKAGGRNQVKS